MISGDSKFVLTGTHTHVPTHTHTPHTFSKDKIHKILHSVRALVIAHSKFLNESCF